MTRCIRFDNIRAVPPDQETIALDLLVRLDQDQSRFDRIDEWVRGVMCDAFREDGAIPGGKSPP